MKDFASDAIERKLEEVQEGLAYFNHRNDAVLRELKRLEATVNKAIDTARMVAIVTIIALFAFVFALALLGG